LKKYPVIGAVIILLAALFAPRTVQAQGTVTFLSNLGQTPVGNNPAGSDSWLAAEFATGTNPGGYLLNSIQLGMTDASGNPSGFTVMIYGEAGSFIGIFPGSSLGTLTGPANPSTAGDYTYTAPSGLVLSPAVYFIVITDATPVANGSYAWSDTGTVSYNPTGGWSGSPGGVLSARDGVTWAGFTPVVAQFAINATAVPEPGVIGLFALGGLLLGFRRWKARSA
jgi:hypothetical protein